MADFYIEQGLARGWSPFGGSRSRAYGPPLKCRHCGSTKVYWQRVHNRGTDYAMHDTATLDPHDCPAFTPTADGFEDEPV
jgi:hypothetical protein